MKQIPQNYGKHVQDRVPADRDDAAADVLRPLLRWTERNDSRPRLRRGDELRRLLLLRQDRAGYLPRSTRHARATPSRLRCSRAPRAKNEYSDAEDLCDPNGLTQRLRHRTQSATRLSRCDAWDFRPAE